MGLYSKGDKSIKIPCDFQEKDKELDSKELPMSPLQDLYWPSWFQKLTFTFLPSLTTCQKFMTAVKTYHFMYICIYIYIFTTEGLLEVAIESWPEWDLNPRRLNSVINSINSIYPFYILCIL